LAVVWAIKKMKGTPHFERNTPFTQNIGSDHSDIFSGKALLSSLYLKGNAIAVLEEFEISSALYDLHNNLYPNINQSKYLFFLIIFYLLHLSVQNIGVRQKTADIRQIGHF
jgi:hypothetical protein